MTTKGTYAQIRYSIIVIVLRLQGVRSQKISLILYLFKGANWTHDANKTCKIEKSIASLSKVQNEALENELDDCKAECRASDGCVGFIQKPDGVCINLRFVDKSRCATDQEGFNLFYNGEYVRFALY